MRLSEAALKFALAVFVSLMVLASPRFAAQQEPKPEEKKQGEQNAAQSHEGEVSFSKDVMAIFKEQKCIVCHRGENPSGLALTEDVAYKSLVNAKSIQNPEALLVKPGDPDDSYLIVKLNGPGKEGQIMPPKGKMPQELIDKIVAWIKQGAKNN